MKYNEENDWEVYDVIKINYYIIRTAFDIENGHVTSMLDADEDFYDILGISKTTYDKLVADGEGYAKLPQKAVEWSKATGIEQAIWTGNATFEIEGCNVAEHMKQLYAEADLKTIRKSIRTDLTDAIKKEQKGKNAIALFNFVRRKGKTGLRVRCAVKVKEICDSINSIDVAQLNTMTCTELEQYESFLEKHIQLVASTKIIKNFLEK